MNSVTSHVRIGALINGLTLLVVLALLSAVPALGQSAGFELGAPATVTEGGSVTLTITQDGGPLTAVGTVDFLVQVNGGACTDVSGETPNEATVDDFVVASGTVTFPVGSPDNATKTITVQTIQDSVRENPDDAKAASECFKVVLSNNSSGFPSGFPGSTATQEITITDDEADSELSIADASGAENAGTIGMPVTLTVPIDVAIDLGAADSYTDVTTEGAADFTAASGAGTIPAGETSGTLNVAVVNDAVYEGDEVVNVTIAAAGEYNLADGAAALTIQDDEGVPELSIASDAETEGTDLGFTVSKSRAAEAAYTANFSYADITATSGTDYTPALSLTITAGSAADQTLTVPTTGDTDVEGTENFIVSIVDGADYDVDAGNGNALGTINDNDGIDLAVSVNVADATIDLDGSPATSVTVVITNNGVETPGTDLTLSITDVGFAVAGATFTSYTGSTAGDTTCDTDATLQTGTCVLDSADFTSGESETLVFAVSADGAAGSTASMTITESGNTETDDSNNADSDTALLVGLDFGDIDSETTANHRITGDLYLGDTAPDAETAAETPAATAGGDDAAGSDDEDGLILPLGAGTLIQHSAAAYTNYVGVESSGTGFVSIIVEYATAGRTLEVNDQPVTAGINWVAVDVDGSTASGAIDSIRLRLCSAVDTCDSDTATLVDGGEIEDYDITGAASNTLTAFTVPSDLAEPLVVSEVGGDLAFADGNGNTIAVLDGYGTGGDPDFTITGNANANTLVVDVASLDTGFDLAFNGSAGSNALEIIDSGASTTWTQTHTAIDASSGSFDLGTVATIGIDYTNLAPILSTITATAATFTFSAVADNIVLKDNDSSTDGLSFIDSNAAEAVTFKTPTSTITVNAGDGADTIDYQGVDETGTPSTTITFNGDAGADTFTILPIANSSGLSLGTVAGGTPTTCPGDVLDMVTTGGAVIDTITSTAGAGTISFTSAHKTVSFSGMESFADQSADLSIAMSSSGGTTVNPGDVLTITLTVSNAGPDAASCVQVDDILFGSDGATGTVLTINSGPTFSVGSYNATTGVWTVGSMGLGDSATITYTATVGSVFNGTASASVASGESDPDSSDNSVSLTVNPAFEFPTKAQATAAEWFGTGANEHLVVGLANGFSGLNSSVLCRVPQSTGFPDNRWRECGDGLPYPLYVNDLYLDDQGTPADSSDDKLYLASWGSSGLYVSEDGGENFTAAEPVLGPKGGWVNVYSILEDDSGFLYISANDGLVFRSLNNGSSWQQVGSLPGVSADTPWSMAAHPTEAGRLYAGTFGNGVFSSDDFGFTWSKLGGDAINALLIADDGGHAFDLEVLPSSNATSGFIFAATGGGVFRMPLDGDGDSSGLWTMIDTDVTLDSGTVTPEARSLAFDSDEDLYVTTWGHGAFFSSGPTTATSMTQIALRGANVAFVAISPSGDEVLFGTEADGLVFAPAASVATNTEDPTVETEIPNGYVLGQNYPNPFNPVTTISFALPQTGQARLAVYDVLGREVSVLVQGTVQAGQHEVQFDAAGLPTGTYIYRLETDKGAFTKQLVLMK